MLRSKWLWKLYQTLPELRFPSVFSFTLSPMRPRFCIGKIGGSGGSRTGKEAGVGPRGVAAAQRVARRVRWLPKLELGAPRLWLAFPNSALQLETSTEYGIPYVEKTRLLFSL